METTDEERENICKIYEEKTNDLLEEWITDDNEDEKSLSGEGNTNDEVDGLKKDLQKMFGNCFGTEYSRKEISRRNLNYPLT